MYVQVIKQPPPRGGTPRVGQGPEGRIRAEYRARRHGYGVHEYGMSCLWMGLARRWKRPIKEIKRICKGESA